MAGVVANRVLRLVAIAAAVVVSILVALTFGLVPPELATTLSETFRGGPSAGDDEAS